MAKIDRLKARAEKRQRRIGKQSMKDAGFTRKEIKTQKLQSKAASTLAEAKHQGTLGTNKGVRKMVRLGEKYNRQVSRPGFAMKPGSREVTSPGITRKDDKTNAFSVGTGTSGSNTLKSVSKSAWSNFIKSSSSSSEHTTQPSWRSYENYSDFNKKRTN